MGALANLDMDTLRTLVKGIELRSFARAAVAVGRSQSAVSGQMRKLEDQVGEPLFRRVGRGLAPTPACEALVGYARRILELNDEALHSIRTSRIDGAVKLGLPADFAEAWLHRVLGTFTHNHPRVQIEVHSDRSTGLVDRIATGRLDLALAWGEIPVVKHSEMLGLVPTGWIISAKSSNRPSLDHPLPIVAFDEPCVFRRLALSALDDHGIGWRLAFISPNLPSLWAAVDAGLGISIRTSIALPPSVTLFQPSARVLPPLPPVPLSLLRSSAYPSAAAAVLAKLLKASVTSPHAAVHTRCSV